MELYNSHNDYSETEKVSRLMTAFNTLISLHSPMRNAQMRALEVSVGNILDPEMKKRYRQQRRQIVEIPIPQQTLLYVAGTLQKDTPKFKAVPRNSASVERADQRTQLHEWAMEQSRGYQWISKCGMHSAIAKRGVLNMYWDMDEDKPCMGLIDPLLAMFDPDPGQSRFVCYFPMTSAEELISIYAKYLDSDKIDRIRAKAKEFEPRISGKSGKPTSWTERFGNTLRDAWNQYRNRTNVDFFANQWLDNANGLYRTVEWHDSRTEIVKFAYSPRTGNFEMIPAEENDNHDYISQTLAKSTKAENGIEDIPLYPDGNIQEHRVERVYLTVMCPALLPEELVLEIPHPIQGCGFALKKLDCYDWHPDPLKVQSIVDSLDAPTGFYNHYLMWMTELLKKTVNPGVDAQHGSIDPIDLPAWLNGESGIMRFFNKTATIAPQERKIPVEAFKLAEVMKESSKELVEFISGIGASAKGYQESAGESGVLNQKRTQQTQVMISYFFGQLRELTHDVFLYMDKLMKVFLTEPRELALLGDVENPKFMFVNTDETNMVAEGSFDFVPDPRSLGESDRMEKFLTLAQMKEMVAGDPILTLYVVMLMSKYIDIPDAKKFEGVVMQRLQMAMKQEGMAQAVAEGQARFEFANKAKELMSPPKQQKQLSGKAA